MFLYLYISCVIFFFSLFEIGGIIEENKETHVPSHSGLLQVRFKPSKETLLWRLVMQGEKQQVSSKEVPTVLYSPQGQGSHG